MSYLDSLLILQPHMESTVGQSDILAGRSHANENHVLKNVNKLREFLLKCPNAVVFDDQVSFCWAN